MEDDTLAIYSRDILNKCFWNDYAITEEDIAKIIKNGDAEKRQFLISKMIQNYPAPETIILAISKEELRECFPIISPKYDHQQTRYSNLRYLIFGENIEPKKQHKWAL